MNRPANLPSRLRAALFDFDETMIDLEEQHDAAHRELCTAMGSDYGQLPESFRFGSGRRIVDDVAEMRRFFGWTADSGQLYRIRHRFFLAALRTANLSLMAGVDRAVRGLHARGLTLAVTTSADAEAVSELLARFSLRPFFAEIVGGSDVTHGKPNPEAYLVTAARLGLPPVDCVVFEDSTPGVLAAKRAGTWCIGVRNPRARIVQDLSAADLVLDSFEALDADWF